MPKVETKARQLHNAEMAAAIHTTGVHACLLQVYIARMNCVTEMYD